MSTRIAIVDDDALVRHAVSSYLRGHGFDIGEFDGGAALRESVRNAPPDLVVLDLIMPGEDGLSVLRWLRSFSDVPVIMLTGNDATTDRVVGLELGADDYVAKPCDMRELLARVRSVLRRKVPSTTPAPAGAAPVAGEWFGRWRLDRDRHRLVDSAGEVCPISAKDYALLVAFADHPNVVMSRDKLMELSGADPAEVFDRALDLRITRLRKKIEPVPGEATVIRTIRGHGGGYEYVPSAGPQYGR